MKIIYIFRAPSKERSIERVFEPIAQCMCRGCHVSKSYAKRWKVWPISMIYNILKYTLYSYFQKEAIFHITGDVQYVACLMNPSNTIITIHDCVTLHNENTPSWFNRLVYELWYKRPLERLTKITCISEATYQDLVHFFPWVKDKLVVIPNPISPDFKYTPKEFYSKCPTILHIGTRSNKNLDRVIQALDSVICRLVIIGELTDKQKALLEKHKINYKNLVHISDEEIVAAYKNADIISFPSLFEGFGLPIIEGQVIGRPVLTSNREPMCSVAGKGALFVDPESVNSIHEGFMKLISDSSLYNSINERGQMNAIKYNIDAISNKFFELYSKKK